MKRSCSLSRRRFIHGTAAAALGAPLDASLHAGSAPVARQATGTRAGEVTDTSAMVWTRLTRHPVRNNDGIVSPARVKGQKKEPPVTVPVEQLEGACPGMEGSVKLRYGLKEDLSDAVETGWIVVTAETDFIHHFKLNGLRPDSTYHYACQTRGSDGQQHGELRGKFFTAPSPDAPSQFRFCVMTCQGYPDRDHTDGHPIYPSMLALKPKFVTMTGDLVYYDSNPPRAVSPALARLHWERMFSLPRLLEMMRSASSYWLKDDHDTVTNDCWPGMNAGELTFNEGIKVFRQQAPIGDKGKTSVFIASTACKAASSAWNCSARARRASSPSSFATWTVR
jgi:alkaline phosphatase D